MKNIRCNHTINKLYQIEYEDWDGNLIKAPSIRKESAFEDVDIHRCKCQLCGKIEYYSQAAYDYFVNGITSPIKGLN